MIKINPLVAHLMDADYDGDLIHIVFPLSEQAMKDLHDMDPLVYIDKYPEEFHPGKEAAKYGGEWTSDANSIHVKTKSVRNVSTNGKSISYLDLMEENYTDSYFDGTKVNRKELAYFSKGVDLDEIISRKDPSDPDVKGFSVKDAIRSYRTIKSLVAKFGEFSNLLITIAIARTKPLVDSGKDNYREIVTMIARVKHILCQDGLSAKHGSNKVESADRIQKVFFSPEETTTKKDYIECLTEFGVPDKEANAVTELVWNDPPISIREYAKSLCPSYFLTRPTANIDILDMLVDSYPNDNGLVKMFIESTIHHEVTNDLPAEINRELLSRSSGKGVVGISTKLPNNFKERNGSSGSKGIVTKTARKQNLS